MNDADFVDALTRHLQTAGSDAELGAPYDDLVAGLVSGTLLDDERERAIEILGEHPALRTLLGHVDAIVQDPSNFGAEDGVVFAGQEGACTITVTNGTFEATADGTVRVFEPIALGVVPIPGFANDVDVQGTFAFVAAGSAGLQAVDVGDPADPAVVGAQSLPGNANDVKLAGDLALVASGADGLQIVDVSDPTLACAPDCVVGSADTPGTAQDLVVRGDLAFVADGAAGLQVIDFSNPAAPLPIGGVEHPGQRGRRRHRPGTACSLPWPTAPPGSRSSTSPTRRRPRSSVASTPGTCGTSRSAPTPSSRRTSRAPTAWSRSGSPTRPDPIVLDSSPPETAGRSFELVRGGRFTFGADFFFVNGVPIDDVSAPDALQPRAILDFSAFGDDEGTGIAVDATYAYLTAASAILENGTTGDSRLYVGQFLERADTNGVPPQVAFVSVGGGDPLIEQERITIDVDATDDVAVAGVELLVNGVTAGFDASPPFQFAFEVPTGVSGLSLVARAFDLGGLADETPAVVRSVTPDPLTTIRGVAVDATGAPVSGADVTFDGIDGLATTTGADGSFVLADVSTILGDFVARVTASTPGGLRIGLGDPVPPVRGGDTDVWRDRAAGHHRLRGRDVPGRCGSEGGRARRSRRRRRTRRGRGAGKRAVGVAGCRRRADWAPEQRFPLTGAVSALDVELADLDGDDVLDAVTANERSANVSVALGLGDGMFGPAQSFGVGDFPKALALGDLDGDDLLDVVTSNERTDDVTVLLGNGDGTFATGVSYAAGNGPTGIALGDLDDDDAIDVIVSLENLSTLIVLAGDGSGALGAPVDLVLANRPLDLATADLDDDGHVDVVAASDDDGAVSVLLGLGNGGFAAEQSLPFATGSRPSGLAVGDVNDDDWYRI